MFCLTCNEDLYNCKCPDFPERMKSILECQNIYFTPDQEKFLREKIARMGKESAVKGEK